MAVIKEYREFFQRNTQVNSGTRADQQTGYPTQYNITLPNNIVRTVYNRFLKDHIPSEDVFKKLMESITFKLNPEDTATKLIQGLVKVADGIEVINRTDTSGTFQLVSEVSALPEVKAKNSTVIITEKNYNITDNTEDVVPIVGKKYRKRYYAEAVMPPVVTVNYLMVTAIGNTNFTVDANLSPLKVANTLNFIASELSGKAEIKIKATRLDIAGTNVQTGIYLRFGNTSVTNNNKQEIFYLDSQDIDQDFDNPRMVTYDISIKIVNNTTIMVSGSAILTKINSVTNAGGVFGTQGFLQSNSVNPDNNVSSTYNWNFSYSSVANLDLTNPTSLVIAVDSSNATNWLSNVSVDVINYN